METFPKLVIRQYKRQSDLFPCMRYRCLLIFATLKRLVEENSIAANRMFNYDELRATSDKYFDGFSQKRRGFHEIRWWN